MLESIKERKIKRVRSKISGTSLRPRLAVFRSLKSISAQLIDDEKKVTLASAKGKITTATEVGKTIAKKALEKKISQAVFDRRNYLYQGNVKKLAEGARAGGLKI